MFLAFCGLTLIVFCFFNYQLKTSNVAVAERQRKNVLTCTMKRTKKWQIGILIFFICLYICLKLNLLASFVNFQATKAHHTSLERKKNMKWMLFCASSCETHQKVMNSNFDLINRLMIPKLIILASFTNFQATKAHNTSLERKRNVEWILFCLSSCEKHHKVVNSNLIFLTVLWY